MVHQPRQLARRARIQRAQGIEMEEKAWQLSLQGWKQVEIANRLGISPTRVSRYLSRRMSRIEESAPQAPEELAAMRAIQHERLMAIYAEAAQQPVTPQSLGTQLKCLAQIAKLFGLNIEVSSRSRSAMPPAAPCAAPEEIAEAVRLRLSEMHPIAA